MIRCGSQQDDIPGRAVQVREAAAVLVPHVAKVSQGVRLVKPSRRMIDPHGMEGLYVRELFRAVRVSTDDARTVTFDPDDASMLPVAYFFLIGKLQLPHEILCHGILLGSLLHVIDKTWPFSPFQLVQKGRIGFSHILFFTSSFLRSSYFIPVIHKDHRRQDNAQGDIDDNTGGKGPEGLHAEGEHFGKTGGKADAQKTEDEGP